MTTEPVISSSNDNTDKMEPATKADSNSGNNNPRKKRLSKKDQKTLKRKRRKEKEEPPKITNAEDTIDIGTNDKADNEETNTEQPLNDVAVPSKENKTSTNVKDVPFNDDDCMSTYFEIPLPSTLTSDKTLGKWFPKAKVVKQTAISNSIPKTPIDPSVSPKTCSLVLFYQYTPPDNQWSQEKLNLLTSYLTLLSSKRKLGGRIRVAPEGVNATVSSLGRDAVRHLVLDLRKFDPDTFAHTDFKFVDDLNPDRHFKDCKVLPVKELVFYGFKSAQMKGGAEGKGIHLDAEEFHNRLSNPDAVVIDVRNHYEAAIGRFDGQQTTPDGARYIDPKMRKSTDFAGWLSLPGTKEKLKDKHVLMYCTGGVRCEKASKFLNCQIGKDIKGVYQLQGGIEKYLQTYPDGGHFRGKNYVFDKREAVSVNDPNGDGGVVRGKKANTVLAATTCCICQNPWDRYIGKKKCFTCGVPVLMCDKCMSGKLDAVPGEELKVRCPLCVEEKVTVPASEVAYTDNGKKSAYSSTSSSSGDKKKDKKVAASSVCKWGGGHATKKKEVRKMKRKICQFGTECSRKDCFFAHPERK